MSLRRKIPTDMAGVKKSRSSLMGKVTAASVKIKGIKYEDSSEIIHINSTEVKRILASLEKTAAGFEQSLEEALEFVPVGEGEEAFYDDEETVKTQFEEALNEVRDQASFLIELRKIWVKLSHLSTDVTSLETNLENGENCTEFKRDMETTVTSLRDQCDDLSLSSHHPVPEELEACTKKLGTLRLQASASISTSILSSTLGVLPAKPAKIGGKLPPISLPTFNGDIMNWSNFWMKFSDLVDKKEELSTTTKLTYLKQAIQDPAAQVMLNSPTEGPSTYKNLVKSLHQRYERTKKIHRDLVAKMDTLPEAKNTSSDLRKLVDDTTAFMASIKQTGHYTLETFVTSMIYSRLPYKVKLDWDDHHAEERVVAPYTKLLEFVSNRAYSLADNLPTSTKTEPSTRKHEKPAERQQQTRRANVHVATAPSPWRSDCPLCPSEKHALYQCQKWLNMTYQQRMEQAKARKLCHLCLTPGHTIETCKSKYKCFECKLQHSITLHPPQSPLVAVVSPDIEAATMMTAQVLLTGPSGSSIKARAMIDPGAAINLITSKAAQELNLPLTKANLRFSGVSGAPCKPARHCTEMNISNLEGTKTLQLKAAVVPIVTELIPAQEMAPIDDLPHLSGLELADPTFHIPGKIDILLGAKVFVDILTKQMVKGLDGEPAAMETIFGWAIGGAARSLEKYNTPIPVGAALQKPEDQIRTDHFKQYWTTEQPEESIRSISSIEQEVQKLQLPASTSEFYLELLADPQDKIILSSLMTADLPQLQQKSCNCSNSALLPLPQKKNTSDLPRLQKKGYACTKSAMAPRSQQQKTATLISRQQKNTSAVPRLSRQNTASAMPLLFQQKSHDDSTPTPKFDYVVIKLKKYHIYLCSQKQNSKIRQTRRFISSGNHCHDPEENCPPDYTTLLLYQPQQLPEALLMAGEMLLQAPKDQQDKTKTGSNQNAALLPSAAESLIDRQQQQTILSEESDCQPSGENYNQDDLPPLALCQKKRNENCEEVIFSLQPATHSVPLVIYDHQQPTDQSTTSSTTSSTKAATHSVPLVIYDHQQPTDPSTTSSTTSSTTAATYSVSPMTPNHQNPENSSTTYSTKTENKTAEPCLLLQDKSYLIRSTRISINVKRRLSSTSSRIEPYTQNLNYNQTFLAGSLPAYHRDSAWIMLYLRTLSPYGSTIFCTTDFNLMLLSYRCLSTYSSYSWKMQHNLQNLQTAKESNFFSHQRASTNCCSTDPEVHSQFLQCPSTEMPPETCCSWPDCKPKSDPTPEATILYYNQEEASSGRWRPVSTKDILAHCSSRSKLLLCVSPTLFEFYLAVFDGLHPDVPSSQKRLHPDVPSSQQRPHPDLPSSHRRLPQSSTAAHQDCHSHLYSPKFYLSTDYYYSEFDFDKNSTLQKAAAQQSTELLRLMSLPRGQDARSSCSPNSTKKDTTVASILRPPSALAARQPTSATVPTLDYIPVKKPVTKLAFLHQKENLMAPPGALPPGACSGPNDKNLKIYVFELRRKKKAARQPTVILCDQITTRGRIARSSCLPSKTY